MNKFKYTLFAAAVKKKKKLWSLEEELQFQRRIKMRIIVKKT